MIWTFEMIAAATAEAESWKGTKHRNRMAKRGVGIDCIHFIFEVLYAADVVPRRRLPAYPISWGIAAQTSTLGELMAEILHVRRIPDERWTPAFGDILVFKVGQTSNHAAIMIGRRPWHSVGKSLVGPTNLKHARTSIQEAIRITTSGWRSEPGQLNLQPCRQTPGST